MLEGFVNSRGEPLVHLRVVSSTNRAFLHPAVIDTGFNGNLSVPEKLARRYGWQWIGYESYEIATGDVVQEKVFLGRIQWFDETKEVYVVTSHAKDILIGTRLLQENLLAINFQTQKLEISNLIPHHK